MSGRGTVSVSSTGSVGVVGSTVSVESSGSLRAMGVESVSVESSGGVSVSAVGALDGCVWRIVVVRVWRLCVCERCGGRVGCVWRGR